MLLKKLNRIKIFSILKKLGYFFLAFSTEKVYCARLQARVAKGSHAEPGQFPFHVAVKALLSDKQVPLCGGSIINEKWVLTAAHCIVVNFRVYDKGVNVEKVTVVAGDIFLNPMPDSKHSNSRQEILASKYIYPLNYESRCQTWDIGLINLSENIKFNDQVKSISLPEASMFILPNTRCTVSGWGIDENGQVTAKLRWGTVNTIDEGLCTTALGFEITSARVCAGTFGGGTHGCAGDSGGPLACVGRDGQKYLYGATSFGLPPKKCGDPANPTVYTKVNAYRSWIDCIMETPSGYSATESAYSCQHLVHRVRGSSKYECIDNLESSGFAKSAEYPYQVAVNSLSSKNKVINCGGVILNSRWVLTAAQCLIEKNKIKTKALVIAGDRVFVKPGQTTTQRRVKTNMHIVPENYRFGCKTYDIGLASLSEDLKYGRHIKPIDLPDQTLTEDCFVTGWGVPVNNQISTQKLKWAQISVVANDVCEKLLNNFFISESRICAGVLKGNRASCTSDIGGPLVCPNKRGDAVVRGIASFRSPKTKYGFKVLSSTKKCEEKDNPVVFTLVSYYLKWIECVMAADGKSEQIVKNCQKEIQEIKAGSGECGNGVGILVFIFVFSFMAISTLVFMLYVRRIMKLGNKSETDAGPSENS